MPLSNSYMMLVPSSIEILNELVDCLVAGFVIWVRVMLVDARECGEMDKGLSRDRVTVWGNVDILVHYVLATESTKHPVLLSSNSTFSGSYMLILVFIGN